jgi:DUF4097 and DUF4098 domain-containing protein YvlB
MARSPRRTSGVFTGLVLLIVGVLLLLHNYRGLDLGEVLLRWWPLALIFLGAIKLYERAVASRSGEGGSARITAGEILLVVGMITLLSCVVAYDYTKRAIGGRIPVELGGDSYPFDLDVTPVSVPANARITVHGGRGDISIRASDTPEIRVSGKKNVHAWDESDAQRRAGPITVEIAQNGDGYDIHPSGIGTSDSRIAVDMDIQVPKKASVTVRNEKGNITVSDLISPVSVTSTNGDVEVRNTGSDVNVEMHQGDVRISDTKGDVKISGRGGEVDVTSATGSFTLDGEFYGPIRAEKVAKGLRFISQRTDLTLTQLTGHMEASSGNLEIVDAPGDISLRTNRYSVTIENATGKVKIDNRDGDVELRFSSPPKEDIDISNSNASISLTLPESSSFNIGADCHSCDVDSEFSADTLKKTTSESGDSHFEGRYGSGRGPKIALKTSYGSISIHKTT